MRYTFEEYLKEWSDHPSLDLHLYTMMGLKWNDIVANSGAYMQIDDTEWTLKDYTVDDTMKYFYTELLEIFKGSVDEDHEFVKYATPEGLIKLAWYEFIAKVQNYVNNK